MKQQKDTESPGRDLSSGDGAKADPNAYERFERMMKRLLKVPKEEIKRREEQEKRARPH
jgi:hypothetical protein